MHAVIKLLASLCLLLSLIGCQRGDKPSYAPQFSAAAPTAEEQYIFGVHPLHNPKMLNAVFGPLVQYLSRNMVGATFQLEASRNYHAFEKKLYNRHFAFALPNPYETLVSLKHGYRVFGKMGDDREFRGIILVRRDSGIKAVTQLKGKAVSFPAPTALAATMLPLFFLQTHGLNVGRDIHIRYVGSQESSIMHVYLGDVAAGATWPSSWRAFERQHPGQARSLKVMWRTRTLPNNGLVVRDDVPQAVAERVAELLFSLQDSAQGRTILMHMQLSRFEPASAEVYAPVERFMGEFRRRVHIPD